MICEDPQDLVSGAVDMPVPISNTEAKHCRGDDSESKNNSLPDRFLRRNPEVFCFYEKITSPVQTAVTIPIAVATVSHPIKSVQPYLALKSGNLRRFL